MATRRRTTRTVKLVDGPHDGKLIQAPSAADGVTFVRVDDPGVFDLYTGRASGGFELFLHVGLVDDQAKPIPEPEPEPEPGAAVTSTATVTRVGGDPESGAEA